MSFRIARIGVFLYFVVGSLVACGRLGDHSASTPENDMPSESMKGTSRDILASTRSGPRSAVTINRPAHRSQLSGIGGSCYGGGVFNPGLDWFCTSILQIMDGWRKLGAAVWIQLQDNSSDTCTHFAVTVNENKNHVLGLLRPVDADYYGITGGGVTYPSTPSRAYSGSNHNIITINYETAAGARDANLFLGVLVPISEQRTIQSEYHDDSKLSTVYLQPTLTIQTSNCNGAPAVTGAATVTPALAPATGTSYFNHFDGQVQYVQGQVGASRSYEIQVLEKPLVNDWDDFWSFPR